MTRNPDMLDGWGAIELHLGIGRRTVKSRGYPIRYHVTRRVYAFASELLAHERGEVLFPKVSQTDSKRP
jgi:hypothetical protein